MEISQMTNSTQIITYALQGVVGTVEKAKDFAIEQAPDLVHQLITYNIGQSIVAIICCAVVIPFLWKFGKKFSEDSDGVSLLMSGGLIIGVSVGIIVNILRLVKLIVAPKVWLIEYAAKLISGN